MNSNTDLVCLNKTCVSHKVAFHWATIILQNHKWSKPLIVSGQPSCIISNCSFQHTKDIWMHKMQTGQHKQTNVTVYNISWSSLMKVKLSPESKRFSSILQCQKTKTSQTIAAAFKSMRRDTCKHSPCDDKHHLLSLKLQIHLTIVLSVWQTTDVVLLNKIKAAENRGA